MKRPSPGGVVLFLLCLMYLITYVDRVIIATAAGEIGRELSLSNTQLGLVFSAFAYPYLLTQVFGGWLGDRVGPRRTLFVCGLIWSSATILTSLAGSVLTLFLTRVLLGIGQGATFPVATRAMQGWTPEARRGFAQGITHAFARFGNAITPPLVAWLIVLVTWRGSFVTLGGVSLLWVVAWLWYFRDDPAEHKGMTSEMVHALPDRGPPPSVRRPHVPWGPLTRRMLPVIVVYFCYGWTLWLYVNWLPSFFLNEYNLDLRQSAFFASAVFFAGVCGNLVGGEVSDRILRRSGDLKKARRNVVIAGLLGSFACMLPIFMTTHLTVIVLALGGAFFCAEVVIGPMWAIPMDIAGQYSGTASGLMNSGAAFAGILSPVAFGMVADATGSWVLPFVGSLGLLLLGAAVAPFMHPERSFAGSPAGDIAAPAAAAARAT